jgi:hypothetical protein
VGFRMSSEAPRDIRAKAEMPDVPISRFFET